MAGRGSMNWYFEVLKKYAVFDGRAHRTEFWLFFLFSFIISFFLGVIVGLVESLWFITTLYALAVLIPGLAVSVRRLHDTNRSGWWILTGLVPILGWIALLIFYVEDSQPGANQYGPNPKGVQATQPTQTVDERLRQLELLRSRGTITLQEYEERRRDIISDI